MHGRGEVSLLPRGLPPSTGAVRVQLGRLDLRSLHSVLGVRVGRAGRVARQRGARLQKTPRSPKSSPSTSLATALMLKSACGGARGRGARGRGGGLRRRVAWRGGAARVDSCAGGATQRAEKRALNRWPGRTDGNAGQSAPGCPGPGPGGASDTMRGCPLIASGTPLSPLPRPLRDCMAREKAAESHAGAGASETHPRARQTGPRPGTESLGTRCPVCRIARARAGAARRRGACGVGRNPGEARSRTCRSGWGRGARRGERLGPFAEKRPASPPAESTPRRATRGQLRAARSRRRQPAAAAKRVARFKFRPRGHRLGDSDGPHRCDRRVPAGALHRQRRRLCESIEIGHCQRRL